MPGESGAFNFVLLLHILSAIIGFGAVFLNGLYAAQAKANRGPGGLAISEANYKVTSVAEKLIYAVPILGIILVAMSKDNYFKFSQAWVSAALALYIVGLAISHAVMIPGHRRINTLLREMAGAGAGAPPAGAAAGPPPQAVEIEAIGKRMAVGGLALDVLLVVIVYLMVFKPGL
jgi:uncharacterized membrane protein